MKFAIFPILLFCFALTAGCVRDNTDDCDNTVLLSFSYTGDGETEIFNDARLPSGQLVRGKISRLDLYVFDENDMIVEGFAPYQLSEEELKSQSVRIKLPTGQNYHTVCIGNSDNSQTYSLREGSVYDTKLFHPVTHPDIPTGDELIDDFDHLYHGEHALALTRTGIVNGTVNINSSHFDVIVEVVGHENLPGIPTRANGEPVVNIEHEGVPAWVNFANEIAIDETETKNPIGVLTEDPRTPGRMAHIYEYSVKRSVTGSKIHVKDLEGNLVGPSVDVDEFLENNAELLAGLNLQEAVLPIRIEIERLGVINVTISTWGIVEAKPEF